MKTPFLGIAYLARSRTLASQRLVNLFPEVVESPAGASVGAFYGCPGLVLQKTLGSSPVRGILPIGSTLYAVAGNTAYSLDTAYNATSLGTLATSSGQVSMVYNPTQVAIFDSVGGYNITRSSGAFANIALPFSNPGVAAYQDGFCLVNQVGTFNVWQSNLNDFTTWGALNYTTEDGTASNVVSLLEFHNQVVVFKEDATCFFINAGNPGFAFQRLQGVYPQTGCIAPYSPVEIGETVLWLSRNKDGVGMVMAMGAYEPERVSTHALEFAIAGYPTISDAVGFGYQQEGHKFYCLTFPSGGETWVLDLTETAKAKIPAWHQRAGFSNGALTQYAGICAASFNNVPIIGDYASGNIYSLDLNTYTDNGGIRKWLRSWPALSQDVYEPVSYRWLEIGMETGIGIDPNANPQLVLRYSDDAGYTWSAELYQSPGLTGQTGNIVRWNRLGMSRRGLNSQRVFELSSTDPFKVALNSAEMSARSANG